MRSLRRRSGEFLNRIACIEHALVRVAQLVAHAADLTPAMAIAMLHGHAPWCRRTRWPIELAPLAFGSPNGSARFAKRYQVGLRAEGVKRAERL